MNVLAAHQLTKFYGKARGISEVNLSVEEGNICGFIGPNGAGKSTTIRILLGLITASGGRVEIFGRNVERDKREILKDVGYLPSETMFYSGMRVRDVLRFSANLRKRDCAKEASMLCERLKLDPSRKVEELSLGNRKKVGIVCAMQHRPRLYILDEPTSGLDPLMQREFYALLNERNKLGATVFLSSHVLSEVQRYCTHIAVIREGKLLAAGPVEKLGHTGAKQVTLQGVTEVPKLEGIRNVRREGDALRFLYSGKPGDLLSALSRLPVTDISIGEPDLEEIFLHDYAKEADSHDGFGA